ncbi:unnamed protein product [Cuscuta campestris]|uniref:Uncharacterized protein n=1 Tax=Cuscuta campestris TaxID=132261 RepID=A0A484KD04_9ASTE|nr:unnamed protein product [Cuscuta campestris]
MPNSDGKLYPSLFKPWSNIITRQNVLTQRWEALPIDGNPAMGRLNHRWEGMTVGSHLRVQNPRLLRAPSSIQRCHLSSSSSLTERRSDRGDPQIVVIDASASSEIGVRWVSVIPTALLPDGFRRLESRREK